MTEMRDSAKSIADDTM